MEGAQNPAIRQSLLRRSSKKRAFSKFFTRSRNHMAREKTDLNPANVAAHDAAQDARSPVPRRPRAHVHAGRRGRQPMACRRRKADGSAMQLSWQKREARVATGQPQLLVRERISSGQIKTRSGSLDDVKRGVGVDGLDEQSAKGPAEEAVVKFGGQWLHW
jgi:hypothetical protein